MSSVLTPQVALPLTGIKNSSVRAVYYILFLFQSMVTYVSVWFCSTEMLELVISILITVLFDFYPF